jgi:N-acetyltransferase 10
VGKSTADSKTAPASGSGRTLREITLEEPIRYAEGDKVENWLNNLLCLDCTNKVCVCTAYTYLEQRLQSLSRLPLQLSRKF